MLSPDDIVVQTAYQGSGLSPGKEGDRLLQDVIEHLSPQVEDEPLPDPRGVPARNQGQGTVHDRDHRDDQGQRDDHTGFLRDDALVDDLPEQQRCSNHQTRVEDNQNQEKHDLGLIWLCVADHTPRGPRSQLALCDRGVSRHGAHHAPALVHGHAASALRPVSPSLHRGGCAFIIFIVHHSWLVH